MPKSTAFATELLALVFNATAIADIAENDTSAPLTSLYVAFHTTNPGVATPQTTHEAAYTNYTRVAVVRTTSGWVLPSGGLTENAAIIQFPQCGATGASLTHVSIGTAASGGGKILYSGALAATLAVANLIQPQFAIGDLVVQET